MTRQIDLVTGGQPGSYGSMYVYAPSIGMGQAYSDQDDMWPAVSKLLDRIEDRTKEPVVMGTVTAAVQQSDQGELITTDRRVEIAAKPKHRRKSRAPYRLDWGDVE